MTETTIEGILEVEREKVGYSTTRETKRVTGEVVSLVDKEIHFPSATGWNKDIYLPGVSITLKNERGKDKVDFPNFPSELLRTDQLNLIGHKIDYCHEYEVFDDDCPTGVGSTLLYTNKYYLRILSGILKGIKLEREVVN